MRRLILFCSALCVAASSWAIPAKRVVKTVQQPDGTTVSIVLRGDETFHFYTTLEGTPIRQAADGYWVEDTRDVTTLWQNAAAKHNLHRQRLAEKTRQRAAARRVATRAGEPTEPGGTKKGLLILVNFTDVKMKATSTQEVFNQMLNGQGQPYGSNHGSVREYFQAQSYGQFDIEFDVVGPVTLAHNMAYYGQDYGGEGEDRRPGEMIKEACQLADASVNFADYDWDGDGEVENIYVTYAGYGQASGAPSNTIWPHQWDLASATGSALRLDGVKIDTYATGSELAGTSGSTIDGIGTMCHEYSHCLGLPDFYDTNGSNFGMSVWSIMDYGCYNGDGYCPAGYTAYERMYSGWLEPVELSAATRISGMQDIETHAEAYIIYNDANHNEYYLLANHQLKGWDEEAYGHGLMVLHVDYDYNSWAGNTVNNTSSRQRMTIIPADGSTTENKRSWGGDLWPGTSSNTALTDDSTPAAKLYRVNTDGQKLMHKPITNISETAGLISLDFMQSDAPQLAAPVIDAGTIATTSHSFSVSWGAVENAQSYNLRYTEKVESKDIVDALMLMETFIYFSNGVEADGTVDLSSKLDDYTLQPGWTGSKVYRSPYGVKLASSGGGGYLTTPLIDIEGGNVTLCLYVMDWINKSGKADNSTPIISLIDANGSTIKEETITPTDESFIYLHFSNVPAQCKVKISTAASKRCYVSLVLVFDGDYSEDEIEELFYEDDADDENDDYGYLKAKRVMRRAAAQDVTGISATSYTVDGLTAGTTYRVQVQAVDADGRTSAWSTAVDVAVESVVGAAALPSLPDSVQPYFDLSGRRLGTAAPKRGIYVRQGRKFIVQ